MIRQRIITAEVHARNEDAWVLGYMANGQFSIRRVVWGNFLAKAERREGEEIRRAKVILTSKAYGKPR